jgi:hypothetical protein
MHHVYVDYRADTGTPFYVGKGNDARIADFANRNAIWHRIIAKHGVRREIVLSLEDDHDVILSEEIRLIRELKTRNYHGGANLTDGGEGSLGWDPTPATRQRMREAKLGVKFETAHRENMSRAHTERYREPEERAKTGQQQREVWSDPVYHQRMAETRVGSRNGRAVITENDVSEIRAQWVTIDSSPRGATRSFCVHHGERLGVTPENIYGIITRRSWKHVS